MFFHISVSETSTALASSTDSGICLASTSSMCSFTGGILSPACHAGTGGRASTRAETASTSKILTLNGESCLDYRIIPILTYFSSLSIILLTGMTPGSIDLAGIPRNCPRSCRLFSDLSRNPIHLGPMKRVLRDVVPGSLSSTTSAGSIYVMSLLVSPFWNCC